MTTIIPAILATNEQEYVDKLHKIENNAKLSKGWVQIDFMDNKFVQNKSIGLDIFVKYPTSMKIEAHLMVEYPESWIDQLVKIPQVKRFIIPVEETSGLHERISLLKNHQKQVGLSINPDTNISLLEPFLENIDCILVMSVNPGFSGQKFIVESIDRVKEIKDLPIPVRVGVDGGINNRYIRPLEDAGVDYLVINSFLMEGDINENLQKIEEAL